MAWYDNNWLYRFKITSDETKITEAIDNVLYDLTNAPALFWTHVKSDGGDIRVTQTDGITEVAREVSGFSVGSTVGSLFFKATGLSDTVNTDYYVYYGNSAASEPAAGSTFGRNNVWTSYLCVWHLDEASGNVTDSKAGVTGTNTGVTLNSAAKIRTGGTWDSSDQITAGDSFDIGGSSFTLSAWINPTGNNLGGTIIAKCDGPPVNGYWFLQAVGSTNAFLNIHIDNGTDHQANSVEGIATGLQLVACVANGSVVQFYRNGTTLGGTTARTETPTNTTNTFTIGNYSDVNFFRYPGVIDEVRVSTSVRSANWISTEYNNQNAPNTFWTSGSEENVPIVSTALPFITTLGAKRI